MTISCNIRSLNEKTLGVCVCVWGGGGGGCVCVCVGGWVRACRFVIKYFPKIISSGLC